MKTIFRFVSLAAFVVALSSTTQAAVMLSFLPGSVQLSPTATTGSVDVQWSSNSNDLVDAIGLDLFASSFTGSAASVTIDSISFPGLTTLPGLSNSAPGTTLPAGNPFQVSGTYLFSGAIPVGVSPTTFGTINFSLAAPLTPGVDSFQLDFGPAIPGGADPRGVFVGGANVLAGSTPVTVTAVPEPTSMALCGVLAVAGVTRRQLRRRRERKSLSLAS